MADRERDGGTEKRKEASERGRNVTRVRARSSVQKRGTQERPWIYVDVSPERERERTVERRVGERDERAMEGRERLRADRGEKYL